METLFHKSPLYVTILLMKVSIFCHRIILGSFYFIFLMIPLLFWGGTSELFEFNKMWPTFAFAAIIAAAWGIKMIFGKRFYIQRTPLDIPILLFLLSQIISTIFSLDQHISWWGYYSRFNGGLLATITYIFLYYAYVSHITKRQTIRILIGTLFSGLIVALWGLPSHFGYDPTCYVFRGNLDVSCWTEAFQPKVRIFSTLGQPDWLAAHLAVLIPLAFAFLLSYHKKFPKFTPFYYIVLIVLFYVDLLYTRTRSGVIAAIIGLIIFLVSYIILEKRSQTPPPSLIAKNRLIPAITIAILLIFTFFLGTSVQQIDKFMYDGIKNAVAQKTAAKTATTKAQPAPPVKKSTVTRGEIGGTDSGIIRLYVWRGALEVWKHHPLFGTGVETFAFAYYQYRPVGHNLTSEWDYLYNKAHNEYLNYLATTGIFGLGTYLAMIGLFIWFTIKHVSLAYAPSQEKKNKHAGYQISKDNRAIVLGLLSGYISILISNFFGFSVVTINLFLFLIPAIVFVLEGVLDDGKVLAFPRYSTNETTEYMPWQYLLTIIVAGIAIFQITTLYRYWDADTKYAAGYNLDHAGYWQNANDYLRQSVADRDDEPTFKDELSVNDAVLALNFAKQNDATAAAKFGQEAITLSDSITTDHPNNIVFLKSRVRIFFSLGQLNPKYMLIALQAIQKAHELAPSDAKISYNLGLVYGQTNQLDKSIQTLEDTIKLKKDYKDAYYALGLVYRQKAVDGSGKVVNQDYEKKAVDIMHFILDNFDEKDAGALDSLKTWGEK